MTRPSATFVTIGGFKFPVLSASVSFSTASDRAGMPMMGSFVPAIEISVDLHDAGIMKFDNLKSLFDLAKRATKDKITDIQIEFWPDEAAGLLGAAGGLAGVGGLVPASVAEFSESVSVPAALLAGVAGAAGVGNPICVYKLKGWISYWHTSSGNGGNPILLMSIQPALDSDLQMVP